LTNWTWPLMQNTDSEIGASSLGRTIIRWLLLAFWFNHVALFKVLTERNIRIESTMVKKLIMWKIHDNGMLYRLEQGVMKVTWWLPKIIDIHAIRVESHFLFTTRSIYLIVSRRFIHVNGVVASFFLSPSVLLFFTIVFSDVIHSRWVYREHP